MKCLKKVKEILDKYDFSINLPDGAKTVYVLTDHPQWLYPNKDDYYFMEKYAKHIPQGWYGFAIGTPIPEKWMEALEKIIDELIKCDPNLEIHQIKLKFGGIRFYVISKVIEDIIDIELMIEDKMFNKALIY